jgi:Flp pilus assembly protein TadG
MSCNITSGITLDCRDNQGGIEYIYIANGTGNAAGLTVSVGGTVSNWPGITLSTSWYKFEVPKQTSSFTETITTSEENGTVFYDQQVSVIFTKMEREKRNQIELLARNRKLAVVVKDANGTFWSVGLTRGAHLLSGTSLTGAAYGDRNGYELVFQGLEPDPSYVVAGTIVGE